MKSNSIEISKNASYLLITLLGVFLTLCFAPLGDASLFSQNGHIVELNTNAYYKWHAWTINDSVNAKIVFLFILSTVGTLCWRKLLNSNLHAALFFMLLVSINGVTISTLSLWIASGLLLMTHQTLSTASSSLKMQMACYATAILGGLIAHQLTFWAVLLSILFLFANSLTYSKKWFIACALAIMSGMMYSNLPASLGLPIDAVFVPGYNYIYGVDPLVGTQPERVFINKLWVESRLTFIVIAIAVSTAFFTVTRSRLRSASYILLAVTVLASSLVPDWVHIISPVAALSRNLPNAMLFPIPLLLAGFFPALIAIKKSQLKAAAVLVSLAFFLVLQPHMDRLYGSIISPQKPDSMLLLTPSLYLTKNALPLPPTEIEEVIPLSAQQASIKASHNQDKTDQILLNKSRTRWSTKPANQTGKEWLEVHLKNPVENIIGIDISNPTYIGDYPRGVEVYLGQLKEDTCQEQVLAYKEPWWRGSVETLPNGIRYLTTQNFVKLYFTQPDNLPVQKAYSCVLIKQTGSDPFYEWSVQTLKLMIGSR